MHDRSSELSPERRDSRRCSSPTLKRIPSDLCRWSTDRPEAYYENHRLHRNSLPEPDNYCRDSTVNRRSNPAFGFKDKVFDSDLPFISREQPVSHHAERSRSPFDVSSSRLFERRRSDDFSYLPSEDRLQDSQFKSHNQWQLDSRSSFPFNSKHSGVDSLPYHSSHYSTGNSYARSRSPHYPSNSHSRSRSPHYPRCQHYPESDSLRLLMHGRYPSVRDEVPRSLPRNRDTSLSPSFEKRPMPRHYNASSFNYANFDRSKQPLYDRQSAVHCRSPPSFDRSEFRNRGCEVFSAESSSQHQRFMEAGATLPHFRNRELLDRAVICGSMRYSTRSPYNASQMQISIQDPAIRDKPAPWINVPDGDKQNNYHADVDYRFSRGDWFADEDLRLRNGGSVGQLSSNYRCSSSDKTWHIQNSVGEERRWRPSTDRHPVGDRVVDEHSDISKMKPKMDRKNKGEKSTATNQMSNTCRGDSSKHSNRGHVDVAVVDGVAVASSHTKLKRDSSAGGNTPVGRNTVRNVTDIDMRQSGLLEKRSYNSEIKPYIKSAECVNPLLTVDAQIIDRKTANKVTDADYRTLSSREVEASHSQVEIRQKVSVAKSNANVVKCQSAKALNINVTKCRTAKLDGKLSDVATDARKTISLLVDETKVTRSSGSVTVNCNSQLSSQSLHENNCKTSSTVATAGDKVAKKPTARADKVPTTGCSSNLKSKPSLIPLQRTGGECATGLSPKKKPDSSRSTGTMKSDMIGDEKSKPAVKRVVTVKSLVMAVPISTLKKKDAAVTVVEGSHCSTLKGSRPVAKIVQKEVPYAIKTSPFSSSTPFKGEGNLRGRHEIKPVTLKKMPLTSPRMDNNIYVCDTRTVEQRTVTDIKSIDKSAADNAKEVGCSQRKVRRIVLQRPNYTESGSNETAGNKLTPKRRRWRGPLEPSAEVSTKLPSNDHCEHHHVATEMQSDIHEKVEPVVDNACDFDDVSSEGSCQTELRLDLSELMDDAFDDDLPRHRFDRTKSTRDLEDVHQWLELREKPAENDLIHASNSSCSDVAVSSTVLEPSVPLSNTSRCAVNDVATPDSLVQTPTVPPPVTSSLQPLMSLSLTKDNRDIPSLLDCNSRQRNSNSPRNVSKESRRPCLNREAIKPGSKPFRQPTSMSFRDVKRSGYSDAVRRSRYGTSRPAYVSSASTNFNNARPYMGGGRRGSPGPRPFIRRAFARRTNDFARPW